MAQVLLRGLFKHVLETRPGLANLAQGELALTGVEHRSIVVAALGEGDGDLALLAALLTASAASAQDTPDVAWNLGVTSRASDRLSVMVDYVGERRDGQVQNGVMLGLGYAF